MFIALNPKMGGAERRLCGGPAENTTGVREEWGAHTKASVKMTEVGACIGVGDETGRLSGLLVAVLDRDSVFPTRRAIRQTGLDKS